MNNFYLIVRGDNGKKYGFGHVFRTIRIYKKLQKELKNHNFIFLVNKNKDLIKKIKSNLKKGAIIKNINFFTKNNFQKNDILLFDTLGIEKKFLNYLNKKKIKKIISLDHLNLRNINQALIINGIFFAKKKIFTKNKNIKILQGPQYNTIEELSDKIEKVCSKKMKKKIFLSSGGSDRKNMIIKFLSFLNKFNNLQIFVPIGPGFKISQIKNFKKYENVKFFSKVQNSINLMSKCDFNIVSGGLSMFEGLVSRKPTFVVETYDNQKFAIKYFNKKGLIISLKQIRNPSFGILNNFLKNNQKLKMIKARNKIKINKIFKRDDFQNLIKNMINYINK